MPCTPASVVVGHPRFFLGSDSAPHPRHLKECATACAGVFTSPYIVPYLATLFARRGCLDRLVPFMSEFGAAFYGVSAPTATVTLLRQPQLVQVSTRPGVAPAPGVGKRAQALTPVCGGAPPPAPARRGHPTHGHRRPLRMATTMLRPTATSFHSGRAGSCPAAWPDVRFCTRANPPNQADVAAMGAGGACTPHGSIHAHTHAPSRPRCRRWSSGRVLLR